MLASARRDASIQFVEFLDDGGSGQRFTPPFVQNELAVYDSARVCMTYRTIMRAVPTNSFGTCTGHPDRCRRTACPSSGDSDGSMHSRLVTSGTEIECGQLVARL